MNGIMGLFESTNHFSSDLFGLCHYSSGQPPHGTEVCIMTLINTVLHPCSVYYFDNLVNLSIIHRHPGTWVQIGRSDRSDHGPTVRPQSDPSDPPLDRTVWPWSDRPTLVRPYNLGQMVRLSDLGPTVRPCSDFLALVRLSDLGPMVWPQSDRPTSVRPSDLSPTVRPQSNCPTSVQPSNLSPTVWPQSNSPTSVQQSDLGPMVRPQSDHPTSV